MEELAGRITIYSITGCPHCKSAKAKLQSLNLPYFDINLDEHPNERKVMIERTNQRTVPQIFFNEKHVGGNQELLALTDEELKNLIEYVKETPAPADAPTLTERKARDLEVYKSCRSVPLRKAERNDAKMGPNSGFKLQRPYYRMELNQAQPNDLVKSLKETPDSDEAPVPPHVASGGTSVSNDKEEVQLEKHPDAAYEEELAGIVKEFKTNSGLIRNHSRMILVRIPQSFFGQELVSFVAKNKQVDVDKALSTCQDILKHTFVVPVYPEESKILENDKTLYRLVEHNQSKALNTQTGSYDPTNPASQISSQLRKKILQLYGKYLSTNGKAVDYKGIAKSDEFKEYVELTKKLQRAQINNLSREEKLAFFINIYNALVIHGNVTYGFPENTLQRFKFFNTTRYVIYGDAYSLQDIENGVLRSNRKGVGMLKKPFAPKDPRLAHIVVPNEPLIHFALVCGAKSCPPIKTYSAENIMEELTLSAEAFLETEDGCVVDTNTNTVKLSMIFNWYIADFGGSPGQALKWVHARMADGERKTNLESVMNKKGHKIEFLHYDWGTNTQ